MLDLKRIDLKQMRDEVADRGVAVFDLRVEVRVDVTTGQRPEHAREDGAVTTALQRLGDRSVDVDRDMRIAWAQNVLVRVEARDDGLVQTREIIGAQARPGLRRAQAPDVDPAYRDPVRDHVVLARVVGQQTAGASQQYDQRQRDDQERSLA